MWDILWLLCAKQLSFKITSINLFCAVIVKMTLNQGSIEDSWNI